MGRVKKKQAALSEHLLGMLACCDDLCDFSHGKVRPLLRALISLQPDYYPGCTCYTCEALDQLAVELGVFPKEVEDADA